MSEYRITMLWFAGQSKQFKSYLLTKWHRTMKSLNDRLESLPVARKRTSRRLTRHRNFTASSTSRHQIGNHGRPSEKNVNVTNGLILSKHKLSTSRQRSPIVLLFAYERDKGSELKSEISATIRLRTSKQTELSHSLISLYACPKPHDVSASSAVRLGIINYIVHI
jgi:hypothetical protein